ncbi:MAG: hypothetical protein HYU58_11365 [Proteobacteria bacterium]|nr:hypothetical protein [Pseudomonadota bacterium]
MQSILRIILLVVIACVAILGLLIYIPFAKEGASWSDLPIFAGFVGVALVLAYLWWWASGRRLGRAMIGWMILLPPLAAHGSTAILLAMARIEGRQFASSVRIENYREQPINWPGFDGPVGMEVSLELHHAVGIDAILLAPELHFGPLPEVPGDNLSATLTGGSGYLKNYYLPQPLGDLTLLKPVLFQRVFENRPPADPAYRWYASFRLAPSGKTDLTYFLLPGTIDYLPARNRICLNSRSVGVPICAADEDPGSGCASPNYPPITDPIYALGQDLSALWMAAGSHDMIVDLSAPLTSVLRQHSRLQSNPAEWTAIQKRLEPDGLARAGYRLCPAGDDSHTALRSCYCKAN